MADVDKELKTAGYKPAAAVRKAIWTALSERDENAKVCTNAKGVPEPDTEMRDTERVPYNENIDDYFEREVVPHVPDAWIDVKKTDKKDGEVGIVGYEINFNRYFYKYEPPRPLEEIEAEIRTLTNDIQKAMKDLLG